MVGLELCAATQIEQVAASVWLGWLWIDSTAAVHNIRDRQNHADQRIMERMLSRIRTLEVSYYEGTTVLWRDAMPDKLLLKTHYHIGTDSLPER
jgi:hypothetical protein